MKKAAPKRIQNLVIQALFFAGFAAVAGLAIHNLSVQLAARGISSGFDFLKNQAGFGIGFHLIPYSETSSIGRVFLVGAVNTLFVSVISIVGATILGLIVAWCRLSSVPMLRALGFAYVETLRNVPLLLQFFIWYFAVLRHLPMPLESWHIGKDAFFNIRGFYLPFPDDDAVVWTLIAAVIVGLGLGHVLRVMGTQSRKQRGKFPLWFALPFTLPVVLPVLVLVYYRTRIQFQVPVLEGFNFSGGLQVIPELIAAIAALSLYTGAFIAEVIRGAIQAVPPGQKEAGQALGLNSWQVLGQIVFPQALGHIVPPLISQYLNLLKNSSLAAAIAFPELILVFAGTSLNVSGQAVEIMAMTLGFYLVVSLSISAAINALQSRMLRYES